MANAKLYHPFQIVHFTRFVNNEKGNEKTERIACNAAILIGVNIQSQITKDEHEY